MKIKCLHGFFMFYEDQPGEIARFNTWYGSKLEVDHDFYTFPELVDFPEASILGYPLINLPAIKTYSGKPWKILKENNFTYSILTGLIVPKIVPGLVDFIQKYDYKYTRGLVQPGNITSRGQLVLGYTCHFNFDDMIFKYSEVYYD